MKVLAVVVGLTVAAHSWADEVPKVARPSRGRGWLSGAGVAFIGVGVAAVGVGIAAALDAGQADGLLKAYETPTKDEAPAARLLLDRRHAALTLAWPVLLTGGALITSGLICVVLDGLSPRAPHVGVTGLPSGALVTLSGSF